MKTLARCALVLTLTAMPIVTLVGSASAGQGIVYRGETSEAEPVRLGVLKRDSGRRFLHDFRIFFTVTCEDGSTGSLGGIGFYPRRERLGEGGEFQYDSRLGPPGEPATYSFHVAGTVRFGSAQGTFEFNYANLTEDDQAQLCTTGVVHWSADRRSSHPARITRTSLPEGVTFLEIDRRGEVVEVAAP